MNKMLDVTKIKEKIALAKKIVEQENEPYKTEAFSVILKKLLSDEEILNVNNDKKVKVPPSKEKKNFNEDINKLVKDIGITTSQFNDNILIKENIIQLLEKLKGSKSSIQINATKCILTIHEYLFDEEWMSSNLLIKCLEQSAIDPAHLARNIRKYSENMIRVGGAGKGKKLKYKITGPGKKSALDIIKNTIKGENNES